MSHLRQLRRSSQAQAQAYVDGELDAPAARPVRVHLRQYWWCSRHAQTHRLVRAGLSAKRCFWPNTPTGSARKAGH